MKSLIWIIVIFVLAIGALVVFGGGGSGGNLPIDAVAPTDYVAGNASSSVILIEYADFQCPACRSYYPILMELKETYRDRVAFVYRHLPLKSIHFNAEPAAWASEAAGIQGKFWEMHNLLYEKQNEWASASDLESVFTDYAILLGLDKEKFLQDLDSRLVKGIVADNRTSALKNGLNSTPTFILNGVQIDNPQSVQAFKLLLDKAIRDSQASQ